MLRLVPYEKEVINKLVDRKIPNDLLEELESKSEIIAYEVTGHGYFLTLKVESLDKSRIVCNSPIIIGIYDHVEVGFVVFIEGNKLTLECHGWGNIEIPSNYREQNVALKRI